MTEAKHWHCKHGHEMTPENTGPRLECRRCNAERRKLHRHATGVSKRFNAPRINLDAIHPAALQAFQALDACDWLNSQDHPGLCDAWQALGDAFGWPGRSK